jgi:hypothetical protein
MLQEIVAPLELSKPDLKFQYQEYGQWANGDRIPIGTPMSPVQRETKDGYIRSKIRLQKGLNKNLFGVVKVARLPSGKLEVIDGRQRMTLAITVNPGITEVPAHIIDFSNLTEEEASKTSYKYFYELNDTKKVANEDMFYSQVMQEDPTAIEMKELLEKCNLACGKVNKSNAFASIKYATFEKCFSRNKEAILRAAYLFETYVPFWNDNCFIGVHRWLSANISAGSKKNSSWGAIDHSELLDPNSKAWQSCEEFFEDKVADWQLDDLMFQQYKNMNDWSWGTAVGLTIKWCHWARLHSKSTGSIRVTPIQDYYKAQIGI